MNARASLADASRLSETWQHISISEQTGLPRVPGNS
jgi:hypothetical protein